MKAHVLIFSCIITLSIMAFLLFAGWNIYKMRVATEQQAQSAQSQAESQKKQANMRAMQIMRGGY
jgi:hypothetical protein